MRHTGISKTTGSKLAILYTNNPMDDKTTLVIETDSLPMMYHDALMRMIESPKSQQCVNLEEGLRGELLPNGAPILQELERAQRIKLMNVDDIDMTPNPTQRIPMRDIVNQIKQNEPQVIDPNKYNPHQQNIEAKSQEDKNKVAESVMRQVELLKFDIAQKIKEAKQYNPAIVKQHMDKLGLKESDFVSSSEATQFTATQKPEEIEKSVQDTMSKKPKEEVQAELKKTESTEDILKGIDPELLKEALSSIVEKKETKSKSKGTSKKSKK